nr:retrovirus-related Pol polyprotein from transposon TNT 1-94 [Tanacetum cinerariifolium]
MLGGKLVCWSAKKQQSVAMSFVEAEYVAADGCCVNIMWMKSQLSDYDIHYRPKPTNDDFEARPLKEFIIKFTVKPLYLIITIANMLTIPSLRNYSSTKQTNLIQQLIVFSLLRDSEGELKGDSDDDVFETGEEMDEYIQEPNNKETQTHHSTKNHIEEPISIDHQSPSPHRDDPEPSNAKKSDDHADASNSESSSCSKIFKPFDNYMPITKRQLEDPALNKKVLEAVEAYTRNSTTLTELLSLDASEDDHFTRDPRLSGVEYLNVEGGITSGCFSDMKTFCKNRKLEKVVAVIKSCTPNALAKDDLRKAYEKCNDISQENHALIDTFLKEGYDKDYELNLSMYGKAAKLEKQMDAKLAWLLEKYYYRSQESVGCSSSLANLYLTEKELHQVHLNDEALREILEEKVMDEKAHEEKIRQKQSEDDEFFLEFRVQAKMLKENVFILDSGRALISTQEYMQKVVKDVGEHNDFKSGAWVSATNYVTTTGGTVTGCLGDINNNLKKGKLD